MNLSDAEILAHLEFAQSEAVTEITVCPPGLHEAELERRMNDAQFNQCALNERFGRRWRITDHYLRGAKHPDDFNLSIDKWDSTPD